MIRLTFIEQSNKVWRDIFYQEVAMMLRLVPYNSLRARLRNSGISLTDQALVELIQHFREFLVANPVMRAKSSHEIARQARNWQPEKRAVIDGSPLMVSGVMPSGFSGGKLGYEINGQVVIIAEPVRAEVPVGA